MQTTPNARNAGFTLLEVVVALTITAMLAAVAGPAIGRAIERARTDNSTRELVTALKATRHAARSSGSDALFTLDVATHAYRIANGGERTLVAPATLTLLTAESERFTQTAGAIRFFPDGSSTGGSIMLSHHGREQRVEIDWLTGHVQAVTP